MASPKSAMRDTSKAYSHSSHRHVEFKEMAQVFLVEPVAEYSEDEVRMCWFENFEYAQIKANNKILTKMLEKHTYKEDDVFCFRGLEFKVGDSSHKRRVAKEKAARVVFSEQMRQWQENDRNDELIRLEYLTVTAECQIRASMLGLQDSVAAKNAAKLMPDLKASGYSKQSNVSVSEEKITNPLFAPLYDSDSITDDDDLKSSHHRRLSISSTSSVSTKSITSTKAVAATKPSSGLRNMFNRTGQIQQRGH
jgi:hypothetical protein